MFHVESHVFIINILKIKQWHKGFFFNFRLDSEFLELYETIAKEKFPSFKKYLEVEVSGETEDGIDIVLPSIRYQVSRNWILLTFWFRYICNFLIIIIIIKI